MLRYKTAFGCIWCLAAFVIIAACSDDENSPVDPMVTDQMLSEVSSPVDTLVCANGTDLTYLYRGTLVHNDLFVSDLNAVLDLVESNLLPNEEILFVARPGISHCRRLGYSVSGDVVVQTRLNDREDPAGGRFFAFSRVDGDLILLEVGEWDSPVSLANS